MLVLHYRGWLWDQMYFDPGQYIGRSRSSIGARTRSGFVGVRVREVRDGYVTDILCRHQLYLKAEKCTFGQPTVEYLGLILSEGRVEMDPVKVASVRDWPTP